jgi:NAD(P)-dependent dehydrogenase (short-subunit alcohol dehydrogenase family)
LVDIDMEAAGHAARAIDPAGEHTLALGAALHQEHEAERAVRDTVAHFGRLDVLANVAGVRLWGPITEASPESWEFILGANVLAAAYCAKFAIPEMARGGGGSIVNVSSVYAVAGRSGMAQYDTTKGALLSLTRAMAFDHAGQQIRVNAVCPGATLTDFHIRRRAESTGSTLEAAKAEIEAEGLPDALIKRQARPREIAYGILFLASDEASYITGTTLMIDGGLGL